MSGTTEKSSQRSSVRRRRISTKKQKKRERLQIISFRILVFLGFCGLIALLGYLLLSPTFYLNSLAVSTSDSNLSEKLTSRLSSELSRKISYVPLRNRFLWTRQRLATIIEQDFPEVADFTVSIEDNELFVKANPHRPVMVWCPPTITGKATSKKKLCYGVNKEGEVFPSESVVDGTTDALVITDEYIYPEPGDRVLRPNVIEGILVMLDDLIELGYEISLVTIDYNNVYLTMVTNEDAEVQIDSFILPIVNDEVFQLAIKDILLVLGQGELANIANREDIAKYEVVDLTSPDKVFYTFKKNE